MQAIRSVPDPIERLLRICYFLDKYEGRPDTWVTACPECPPGEWDSAVVGRWFAAKAVSQGVKPTSALRTYVKRPAARLIGRPGYEPASEIPCWSFREGSTETRAVEDRNIDSRADRMYTVTLWAHVLLDGSVIAYEPPPVKMRGPDRQVNGPGTITPSALSEHALVLMAGLLGLTDDLPGMKVRHQEIAYGGLHEMGRHLDRAYIDDYGRPIR
jgi:hypothetical protein